MAGRGAIGRETDLEGAMEEDLDIETEELGESGDGDGDGDGDALNSLAKVEAGFALSLSEGESIERDR